MPALNTATRKFNPSLGPVSPVKTGTGSYIGIPINAETFKVLQSEITIGMVPFVKKATKPNKRGEEYFFLEFLPPSELQDGQANWKKTTTRAKTTEDSI